MTHSPPVVQHPVHVDGPHWSAIGGEQLTIISSTTTTARIDVIETLPVRAAS